MIRVNEMLPIAVKININNKKHENKAEALR